jgi:hypothetical protein
MAHIYIKGTDWKSDPDPRILDPVVSLLYTILREGDQATGTLKGVIHDHLPNLGSSIDAILVRSSLSSGYEVVESVGEDAQGHAVLHTTSLKPTFSNNSEYVDALTRIRGMNHPDRSGDIILLMKSRMADINQRYSTGVSCKSWHGSLNRSDSYVPMIVAYPGGNRSELENIVNVACANNGCSGNWKLPEFIKEIVDTQYSDQ